MNLFNRSLARSLTFTFTGALLGAALTLPSQTAEACGCFAPPDPSVPVVQAGERIVFSHENNQVTAHIQIQYAGPATEFGWLLPMPSVPEMTLGTEELFTQLINTTQPKYRLVRQAGDSCDGVGFNRSAPSAGAFNDAANESMDPDSPLVLQDSIGPFDFAVLRADSKEEMFNWLTENSYFIPTGTDDVVDAYIRPGAYFLALKLQKGNDAGDIQPVVVKYQSDLPMIPIILTSVAANPDMGIQVWVLGDSRAIPRNFRHTVINEEHIDWFTAGQNYNDVIIKAVNEAEGGHAFVTEYAGTTDVMRDLLDYEGRFGDRISFEQQTDPALYVRELRVQGFPWSSGLTSALRSAIPYNEKLAELNISDEDFYQNIDWYLSAEFRSRNSEYFEDYNPEFDAVELTARLWERIVTPTLKAGRMFQDNPVMTRMYTTLSPEEMTKDPVFSYNPSLEDVSNIHEATFTILCSGFGDPTGSGILELPDGRRFFVEDQGEWINRDREGVPYSTRIERLLEEGAPRVDVDNSSSLSPGDPEANSGCACTAQDNQRQGLGSSLLLGLALLGFAFIRRR